LLNRYGANGTERRKVIKHAFKVIFDNIIPDIHKVFIHYNKYGKKISREEVSQKVKKLKVTKKAVNELEGEEKMFYDLLLSLNLTKEQKKESHVYFQELDGVVDQYNV
jgi:hypothetical protein